MTAAYFVCAEGRAEQFDRWRAQVTLKHAETGATIQRTKTCHDRKSAERALIELEALWPDGVFYPETPTGASQPGTVGALLDEWAAHYMGDVKGSTADNYQTQIDVHLKPAFGDVPLTDLKVADVNAFLRKMQTRPRAKSTKSRPEPKRVRTPKPPKDFQPRPLSLSTKRLAKKVLALALDHAISEGRLTVNVARQAKLPKADEQNQKPPIWFTSEEARAFLTQAKGTPLEVAWVLQLQCGMRGGEVRALAWSDIDFANGIIHVRHGQQRIKGRLVPRGRTKTPESVRDIPVSLLVLDLLTEHKDRQDAHRARVNEVTHWTKDDLVLTTEAGAPIRPETYDRTFRAVRDATPLSDDAKQATPHSLRHSYATLLIESEKVPWSDIAKLLGHKDLSMLTQVYGHLRKTVPIGHEDVLSDLLTGV